MSCKYVESMFASVRFFLNRNISLAILGLFLLTSCEEKDGAGTLLDDIKEFFSNGINIGELGIDNLKEIAGNTISKMTLSATDDELDGVEIPALLHDRPEQRLQRMAYSVSYNKDTKLPNWVAWHLTREMTEGSAKRPDRAFHEDEAVPLPRATDSDYQRSGYDRGHMCPAADNKFSEEAMYESFLFTNMCPQTHKLNAGDWEELESACRKWARKYGDIYIVCGPVLQGSRHKTIGKNKVVVPEAFFKVVLCLQGKPKAIGFIYNNNDDDRPMEDYVMTVDEVEKITGMDFFCALPDDEEDLIEARCNLADWGR